MSDKQYFQMEITLGIEADSPVDADWLADIIIEAITSPLYETKTDKAKVFESFTSRPFPYDMS